MSRRLFFFSFQRLLQFIASVCCLAWAVAPAWAQFETRATKSVDSYYGAFSIATGDFNHDGKLDIAVVYDNGFTVSLGNGDGTFGKPVAYYGTESAIFKVIAAGDFNNDGNIDLVTANGYNSVSVYLGNGDGTFQAPKTTSTSSNCSFVAVGNFNGDKNLDIVVLDSPYVSVLLGNGDGTFQPPSDTEGFPAYAYGAAVGDFNNDDKLDVVVVGENGSSYIGVLLGNGDGTLQPPLTYSLEYFPASVAAGDFNKDGNLDVAIGDTLSGVTVLLGNGDGSFQTGITYDTIGGDQIVASDLNGDGKLDLALPGGPPWGVNVLWGSGNGTFQPAQLLASGESGSPVVGDFNGDHLPDFVLVNELWTTTMLNTGVVNFSPTAPLVFPDQLVKTSSTAQSVTLTNAGATALSISSLSVSGQFQLGGGTTCGGSVEPGASCAIAVVFKPLTLGGKSGTISIVDSASSKPQVIELSGQGTVVALSPSSLNFRPQKVGTKSAPMTVRVKNDGSASVTISSVSIGGNERKDFSETDNCASRSLAPGATCSINVTFAPTKTGARSATLFVDDNGGGSPQTVSLSGTGT